MVWTEKEDGTYFLIKGHWVHEMHTDWLYTKENKYGNT